MDLPLADARHGRCSVRRRATRCDRSYWWLRADLCTAGCASLSGRWAERDRAAADDSLTRVVSELKLHLRDDTYRYDRGDDRDGRNVYAVALWKLDRLAGCAPARRTSWENADYVIEFARGKALERLRRYGDAVAAYQRVAASGSVLGDAATERAQVID